MSSNEPPGEGPGAFGSGDEPVLGTPEPPPRRRHGGQIAVVVLVALVVLGGALAFFLTRASGPEGGPPLATSFSFATSNSGRYDVTIDMSGTVALGEQSQDFDVKGDVEMAMDVLRVDEEGTATVRMTMGPGKLEAAGRRVPFPTRTVTLRFTKDGRILGESGAVLGSVGAPGGGAGTQFLPFLPGHPVEVGESWTKTVEQRLPGASKPISTPVHYEFLGYEDLHGVRAAVVTSSAEISFDAVEFDPSAASELSGAPGLPPGTDLTFTMSGTLDTEGTTWFEPDTGRLVKVESGGPVDLTIDFGGADAQALPSRTMRWEGEMDLTMEQSA